MRNDDPELEKAPSFDRVVFSPGPGLPSAAGMMPKMIATLGETTPMLGVCLGHQAICEHFGGRLINVNEVCHGQTTLTTVTTRDPLFAGMPSSFATGHYHSWVVDGDHPGMGINIIAVNDRGWVMAVKHQHRPIYGVQFHPESIMTEQGLHILENWLHCH